MEKKIYITNTGTVICPYKKGQSKALERMTSMRDPGCKFKRNEVSGFRVDELFLTYHLQPFLIKNEFPDYQVEYIEPMKYELVPPNLRFEMDKKFVLNGNQIKVADSVIRDTKGSRWFINCPQGFGKTSLSLYIMTRFRCNTLIMCYSTNILKQWRDRIVEQTNIRGSRVLIIDSGMLIESIIDSSYTKLGNFSVFIATPKILYGYAKKHGYDCIDKLFRKLNIGLKIYDTHCATDFACAVTDNYECRKSHISTTLNNFGNTVYSNKLFNQSVVFFLFSGCSVIFSCHFRFLLDFLEFQAALSCAVCQVLNTSGVKISTSIKYNCFDILGRCFLSE